MALQRVTIGSLSDDVLLVIFCAYKKSGDPYFYRWHDCWPRLVHVCRRWRFVIFASPHRLNLRLFCTMRRPARKLLDIWPPFPLQVFFSEPFQKKQRSGNYEDEFDNVTAALERHDRVCGIYVSGPLEPDTLWNQITALMQEPFPELTSLTFQSNDKAFPLPDTFLNGSAPSLQSLNLMGIIFPSLPRLLLSATDLTSLKLLSVPTTGYIPPETMARCLSALPNLKSLNIEFISPTRHPKRRNRPLPPPARFVLPALTWLSFRGVSEYLEVLAARIDAPLLDEFKIHFFNQLVFDIPQTVWFFFHLEPFRRSSSTLTLDLNVRYHKDHHASISFPLPHPTSYRSWRIKCNRLDWQVFSVAQISSHLLPFFSSVESFIIHCNRPLPNTDIDPTVWLQLFRSFPSVRSLEIPTTLEPSIADTLHGLMGESAIEVFPSLDSLSIVGDMSDEAAQQGIQSFIAARQHYGHPIAVSRHKP